MAPVLCSVAFEIYIYIVFSSSFFRGVHYKENPLNIEITASSSVLCDRCGLCFVLCYNTSQLVAWCPFFPLVSGRFLFIFVHWAKRSRGAKVGPRVTARRVPSFEFVRIKVCKRSVNRAALTNKNRDIRRGENDGGKNRIKSISWSLTPSPVD